MPTADRKTYAKNKVLFSPSTHMQRKLNVLKLLSQRRSEYQELDWDVASRLRTPKCHQRMQLLDQLLEEPISYTCVCFPLKGFILTNLRAEQDEVICAVCGCVNAVFPVSADLRASIYIYMWCGWLWLWRCGCECMSVATWEQGACSLPPTGLLHLAAVSGYKMPFSFILF